VGALRRSQYQSVWFTDVYDDLAPIVLRFFAIRVHDSQLAIDLTAETFAKAFEKRHQFRGHTAAQEAGWIWSIARNELACYHRTRTVELDAVRRLGLERPEADDEGLRRLEELTAKELARQHVEVAIGGLPRDQQLVLRMHFIEDLTYHEIATRLGVSGDVVRARASRAMRSLRTDEHVQAAVKVLET
jgi:RNA polymerase sigma-70 factor (ECF subfamily)